METLKFLLEEIVQRILQYCVEQGLHWLNDWLTEALGIERETQASAYEVAGGLMFLGFLFFRIYRRLTRNRAAGISPQVTPEREAP